MISKKYLKLISSLKFKKFRIQHSLFLVEGYRNCKELLSSGFSIEQFFSTEDAKKIQRNSNLISKFLGADIQCDLLSSSEMNSISDAVTSPGMAAVVHLPNEIPFRGLKNMKNILCLESISDPGNLGSILRTAAWFGVDSVFLSSDSVDRFNPKVVRSSAGAIFQLPIILKSDLNDILNSAAENGFKRIATAPIGGTSIYEFEFPTKSLIIFGSEANGLTDDILSNSDITISIPSSGMGESLNLAISCGIVLGMMMMTK